MIELDGSQGEGGGQILRTALALAVLTGKPFRIERIRARRPTPGLMPQHLASVTAVQKIASAAVEGNRLGSTSLSFTPQEQLSGNFHFDIGTAGAATLVLQTIYLPLAWSDRPSLVTISGGTHVPFSPSFHFLRHHWQPLLNQIGIHLDLELTRAGFYPKGGGSLTAKIFPVERLNPLVWLTRGDIARVNGFSLIANLAPTVGWRQQQQLAERLQQHLLPFSVVTEELHAIGASAMSLLIATYAHAQIACERLGAKGKPVERVAEEAVTDLLHCLKTSCTLDSHIADQLLLPLSLVAGESEYVVPEITGHLATLRRVIQTFLPVTINFFPGTDGARVQILGQALSRFRS